MVIIIIHFLALRRLFTMGPDPPKVSYVCVGWRWCPISPHWNSTCNCLFLQSQRSITLEREISNRRRRKRRRKATHIHRGRQTDKRFRQIHMYKDSRLLLLLLLRFCSIEKRELGREKMGPLLLLLLRVWRFGGLLSNGLSATLRPARLLTEERKKGRINTLQCIPLRTIIPTTVCMKLIQVGLSLSFCYKRSLWMRDRTSATATAAAVGRCSITFITKPHSGSKQNKKGLSVRPSVRRPTDRPRMWCDALCEPRGSWF